MRDDRWQELELNPEATLTEEEIALGWHFCPDWDELFIGPEMEETYSCLCKKD